MAGDVVGVVVGEQHVPEGGVALVDEVEVLLDIEDGVDEQALLVGLDVVGEDGQLGGFELGNVVALAALLADHWVGCIHEKIRYYRHFPDRPI